jgi:hypothetical protein
VNISEPETIALPIPEPRAPSPPRFPASGRPMRRERKPRRFRDELPVPPTAIPPILSPLTRRVILHVRDFFWSDVNQFGILREYLHRPSYDPDAHVQPKDLANYSLGPPDETFLTSTNPQPPPWPFSNMSKYRLMSWFHTGGTQKSEGEITRLAEEVISAPDFVPGDLAGFSTNCENRLLDKPQLIIKDGVPYLDDDWREVSVGIDIPVPVKGSSPQNFQVPGLHHRSIVDVIKATFGAVTALPFHLTPFKCILVDSAGIETRIYDEVYTSEAFEEAHDKLQKQPAEPGCTLEKVIAGLMFWSDSTHLTNFGTASVWPLYMYYANLSKYIRAKPNSGACHHMAYIPYVSFSLCHGGS